MYTSQIILLSGKGIITNAIVDLLPSHCLLACQLHFRRIKISNWKGFEKKK